MLQGSVVDKAVFMDTVAAAGCRNCIIIADKGFYSKKNVSALIEGKNKILLYKAHGKYSMGLFLLRKDGIMKLKLVKLAKRREEVTDHVKKHI